MGLLDYIFGAKKKRIIDYLNRDAVILDVRTKKERDNGHIKSSIHIPVSELKNRVEEVKKLNKPIITCCASGVRSAKAAKYLNLNNIEATNGGGWLNLKKHL